MLSGSSGIGGLSRGEVGGIGAIAGALLGGRSVKGAIGGGAMALLGTLAISALKNWQPQGGSEPATAPKLSEAEVEQMTAPETAGRGRRAAARYGRQLRARPSRGGVRPPASRHAAGPAGRSEAHTSELQALMRNPYA